MKPTHAHLRIARPTDQMDALIRFYRDGLGMEVLGQFQNHDGFDGVMLGFAGGAYHLEFVKKSGHGVGRAPSEDHLLVLYLPDHDAWQSAIDRMMRAGHAPVASFNPYWDKHGKTFEDPDGYRVVFQHAAWEK